MSGILKNLFHYFYGNEKQEFNVKKVSKDALDNSIEIIDFYCEYVASIGDDYAKITKMRDASKKLKVISSGIDRVEKGKKTISALNKIYGAVIELDKIKKKEDYENEKALAKHFGDLFLGLSIFVEMLPPPLHVYAPILANCGTLFTHFKGLPNRRWNADDLDRAFKGQDLRP